MLRCKDCNVSIEDRKKDAQRCRPCAKDRVREYNNAYMRRQRVENPERYRGAARARYAANPEASKARLRAISMKAKYGITPEDYDRMLERQGGVCAICRQPEKVVHRKTQRGPSRLAIDHDHVTGWVRGLLCNRCNTSLGWYERNRQMVDFYVRLYEPIRVEETA